MEKTCEPGNSLSGNFRQTEETKLKMRVFARNFSSKKSRVCAHLRIFSPENSSVHFLALFHFSAGKTAFFGSSFWSNSRFCIIIFENLASLKIQNLARACSIFHFAKAI